MAAADATRDKQAENSRGPGFMVRLRADTAPVRDATSIDANAGPSRRHAQVVDSPRSSESPAPRCPPADLLVVPERDQPATAREPERDAPMPFSPIPEIL